MPGDITGTEIIQEDPQTGHRQFVFERGPVFTQMLLADEINRTPPKTQAALLEAMQEHAVTAAGKTYRLDEPFFVLATQNPIEQEGTYPLPEAQRDRFLFHVVVDYPSRDQEGEIVDRTTSTFNTAVEAVVKRRGDLAVPTDGPPRAAAAARQRLGARCRSLGSPGRSTEQAVGPGTDRMGTRPASKPATGAGSQGPSPAAWSSARHHRRRASARPPGPAPSHRSDVRCRSRWHHRR